MSASPTNTIPEAISAAEVAALSSPEQIGTTASGREALQALLAFSSLHEQIRQRRARNVGTEGDRLREDESEIEPFVLDEVLQMVAERAVAITGADGVAIALADGEQIVCRAAAGSIAPDRGARLDLNSSFSGACFRNAQIVRCDDSETDARVNVQACRWLGTRSMVAAPLSGRRSVIGLLEAFSREAYGFNDSDVRSLNLLGELILAAIKPEEEAQLEQVAAKVEGEKIQEPVAPRHAPPEPKPVEAISPPGGVREFVPEERTPIAILRNPPARGSRPGVALVLVVVLVAVLTGAGLWWKIHSKAQLAMSETRTTPAATSAPEPESASPPPRVMAPMDMASMPVIEEKLAVLPKVTGIRHWSATDSSTVVIDLQDQVQYEAHRLTSPDRIYFDLHDTALAPGLAGKIFEIGDAVLVRVRVAQLMPGVTRVVLETSGDANFSVSMEPHPYRLVAELRAIGAKPQSRAHFDMFEPSVQTEKSGFRSTPGSAEEPRARAQTPKFRIVLDAGHGGWDLGTAGRKGLLEKDLVLDVVQRLGDLLSKRLNAEVVYTRQDDTYVPLEDRAGIANQAQADLFLSIHANYSDHASARGVETYYTNTFSSINARSRTVRAPALENVNWGSVDLREKVLESRRFAASVQRALYGMLAGNSSGIRDRGVKEASYVVLTGATMPAILAEISFVSSPRDEGNLQSAGYRQQIARALYKGVARYGASSHRVKLASTSGKPAGR